MKVRVNKGFLSRQHDRHGCDVGFTVLFPGEYGAHISSFGELEITMENGKMTYLPLLKVEQKVVSGEMLVLEL